MADPKTKIRTWPRVTAYLATLDLAADEIMADGVTPEGYLKIVFPLRLDRDGIWVSVHHTWPRGFDWDAFNAALRADKYENGA